MNSATIMHTRLDTGKSDPGYLTFMEGATKGSLSLYTAVMTSSPVTVRGDVERAC